MSFDQTILKLIMDASLIVKVVMIILVLASLASWTLMLIKSSQLGKAQKKLDIFEDRFWSGISLNKLYSDLANRNDKDGMASIFFNGYHEYARLTKGATPRHLPPTDTAHRAMRVAETRRNRQTRTKPMKQATLAVVAPGIAEALIATAIGLFAAIPAVIAYNRFSDKVDRIAVRYENFREEFTTLLERQAHIKKDAQ
ncbi:Tol-Pal system protein TolQ [Nymphon striatum]|nr:Tol-Pal system protein TolQ [Nymphon striatum]